MSTEQNKTLIRRYWGEVWNNGNLAVGKIAEGWGNFDALGMLQQLDVIPTPEQVQV